MRRYLLDTGIAADAIYHRRGVHLRVAEALGRGDRVGVGMPVVGELFAGLELSKSRDKNRARVLAALNNLRIWPFDFAAAEQYGRIFAELRQLGRPIQQIDIQIAAIALSLGNCTVVSKDSDLAAVPGLPLENWATKKL